jgi:hypothetical protein
MIAELGYAVGIPLILAGYALWLGRNDDVEAVTDDEGVPW